MAQGLGLNGDMMGIPTIFLQAISVGAVFMVANSYIGNGPNFMVKVDRRGVRACECRRFFGYMAYSFAILIPLYIVITLHFLQVKSLRNPAMNSPFVPHLYTHAVGGGPFRRSPVDYLAARSEWTRHVVGSECSSTNKSGPGLRKDLTIG